MTLENLEQDDLTPQDPPVSDPLDPSDPNLGDPDPEVLDPGQLEGVKRDTHPGPPAHHPRFKQIYAEAKQSKAKVEELTNKFAETETVFGELRAQNEQLTKTLQELQTGQQKKSEADQQAAVQTTLADLKAQRAEAYDSNDFKKAAEIQDQIQELTIKMHTPAPKKEEAINIDEALAKREVEQAVKSFTADTPWFNTKDPGYDPIMVGAAKELDVILSKDPVWGRKPVADQLTEVKRRVEERFGYKATGKAPVGGRLPGVGPVNTGGGAARDSYTLSPDQVKVSRMLFPNDPNPEVKYAEQLRLARR